MQNGLFLSSLLSISLIHLRTETSDAAAWAAGHPDLSTWKGKDLVIILYNHERFGGSINDDYSGAKINHGCAADRK